MRYVASKIMWRRVGRSIGINKAVVLGAT
jgi:hypothetical protein